MQIEQVLDRFDSFDSWNRRTFPKVTGKKGHAYWPAQWHKRFAVQAFLHACVSDVKVKGLDHLYEAAALSEENQTIISSNHITDLDHSLKRFIFCKLGLRKFADRLVFPAGLKMLARPQIAIFVPGENALFVMTPFDTKDLAEAKAVYNGLSSDQQVIIDKYERNFISLTRESGREKSRLEKAGKVFVSYPEATRSRTGQLGPGQEAVSAHYPKNRDDVYVIPMVFSGIEQINPPEKMFRFRRIEVSAVFGKPYPVKDIWEKEGGLEKVSRRLAIDRVMARLAVLEPELVALKDREYYGAFLNGYDPNIEAEYHYLPRFRDKLLEPVRMFREHIDQVGNIPGRW